MATGAATGTWEFIRSATRSGVARIVLNRPEKRNAQNLQMLTELEAALHGAGDDPDVRVIVISGAGDCFSAGHDLSENMYDPQIVDRRSHAESRSALERHFYYGISLALRHVPQPTIAQVHGQCIAAGLMLAAMCDLVVAADNAVFSNPVLRMGVAGVELPVEFWAFGERRAKEFLFTGQTITAQTAHAWGFVNRVVPLADLEAEVSVLAATIASFPPEAVRLTKQSINESLDIAGQAASFEHHFQVHQLSHSTDEATRLLAERKTGGVKAWIAKLDSKE